MTFSNPYSGIIIIFDYISSHLIKIKYTENNQEYYSRMISSTQLPCEIKYLARQPGFSQIN